VHIDPIGPGSYQAMQGDGDVFVIRATSDGWKTEGNPTFDGQLWPSKDDLVAALEGRNQ
jgi:hypothetical protein